MSIKETPAQRTERVKREKNPFEILPDLSRWAAGGFESIAKDDLDVRLRAWGLYTQGDGQGVKGKAVPYFLLRIRIPGGQLWAHQVRAIADLSDRYARGTADITDRQNIQLHWLRIEDVPAIFQELTRVGLTSQGACGDVTRNVTSCPLAGLEADEIDDATPLVQAVDRLMNGNPAFANLPRKFKITITGCASWCTYPEINDVGLTALRRRLGRRSEVGYSLRVGGGLATRPHLARRLDAFILPHQVPGVVQGVAAVFREAAVLRENRSKARLKFLFLDHGWDEERFLAELEQHLGYKLAPGAPEEPPVDTYRDHVGIHAQKQPGLSYAGFVVTSGRISPAQLRAVADLAETYGDGSVRTTVLQNILIPNIRSERLAAFEAAAERTGLGLHTSPFRRGAVACTGTEFCKLALTETKRFSASLTDELERRLPGFAEHLKIHVTGCPNSCGQAWIADVGLQGVKVKVDGQQVDGYEFYLGGGVAGHAAVAERVPYRVPASDVAPALERLLVAYLAEREEGERFQEFSRRHTPEELKGLLAGEPVGLTEASD